MSFFISENGSIERNRNAAFILGFRVVTYAIAAGNTVVFKASEISPRSLGVVGTIFREAGLPDGVLNVIQHALEDAAAVTNALIEQAVKKINFTGSNAVGRIIAELAGKNLKPVLLEKVPAIALNDADTPLAARSCTMGAFLHGG
jgi:acyl-CoA reductase-like NAD-dependent aldehyde dehydrogenase